MASGSVRKLVFIAAIGGAVAAAVKALRGDPAPQFSNHPSVDGGPDAGATTPDPIVDTPAVTTPAPATTQQPADTSAPAPSDAVWVHPVDGDCPQGFPIKAKLKSGIFHQPGGLAYDRTNPDRCYPSAAAAESDGLRAAKR